MELKLLLLVWHTTWKRPKDTTGNGALGMRGSTQGSGAQSILTKRPSSVSPGGQISKHSALKEQCVTPDSLSVCSFLQTENKNWIWEQTTHNGQPETAEALRGQMAGAVGGLARPAAHVKAPRFGVPAPLLTAASC